MSVLLEKISTSESAESRPARAQPTRRSFVVYCLAIALTPFAAILASFFIARSSYYLQHQRNSYLAISDYPFTLKDYNCDVVIYGDSSALTGISPLVIEAATSLRTCNIAQPNTALATVGTFALDSYLKNNAPPKFLVFQLTAPDFSPRDPNGRLYEEGALQLVRHKLGLQTLVLFSRHPLQSLEFSEFILKTAFVDRNWTTDTYDRAWSEVRTTNGLFTSPAAPLANCVGALEVRPPDPSWINGLRSKYSQSGTVVRIYVAPYPECDNSYEYYSEKLAQLADNKLQRFSIHLFNEKNHFTREGADLNSKHIAEDIAMLRRD